MRVLLDENLPVGLAHLLPPEHDTATVAGLGWQGVSNGELLARMEGSFDVLLTMDRGMRYQQVLAGRPLAILGLRARSNRLPDLRALVPEILDSLDSLTPGEFRALGS